MFSSFVQSKLIRIIEHEKNGLSSLFDQFWLFLPLQLKEQSAEKDRQLAAAAAATEAAEAAEEEAKRKAEEEFKSELEDERWQITRCAPLELWVDTVTSNYL